jgi:predicted aspartyl protease
MRRLSILVGVAAVAVLSAAGGGVAASPPRAHAAATVPLRVIKSRDGQAAALVRVVIHGRSFPFLIDTGASRSLVDVALARQLHLRRVGRPVKVGGVGCTTTSRNVRLSRWRVGGQPLPSIVAASTQLPFAMGHAFGLLGSDVLSRFGAVTIDYKHAVLTLG